MMESLASFKTPDWSGLNPPAFLADTALARSIENERKIISGRHRRLKDKLNKALREPAKNDPIFRPIQKLFQTESLYNLLKSSALWNEICEAAKNRYVLGYPPRKEGDTSCGDAINWEWIIRCAQQEKKHVIIVSRDKDYGHLTDHEQIINDWLLHEFKERVSQRRNLILTNRLTHAFKLVNIHVTQQDEKQEQDLIKSNRDPKTENLLKNYAFEVSPADYKSLLELLANIKPSVPPQNKEITE